MQLAALLFKTAHRPSFSGYPPAALGVPAPPRPQAWPAECSVTVLEHRYLVHIPSKTIVSSLLFPVPRQEPGDACRGGPVGCIPEQKRSSKATSGPLWAYDTSEHQS